MVLLFFKKQKIGNSKTHDLRWKTTVEKKKGLGQLCFALETVDSVVIVGPL